MLGYLETRTSDLSEDEEDAVLSALPEPLRILHVLSWLDFEVCQSSLTGYFFNAHGRQAGHAAAALRAIGAGDVGSVVEEAAAVVRAYAAQWEARHAELDRLPEGSVVQPFVGLAGVDRLAELDRRFAETARASGWGQKLESYLADAVDLHRDGDPP